MTVGHAPVPDAQEVEDRRGQRMFVGLRNPAAVLAAAAAIAAAAAATTGQNHRWPAMGTAGHRAVAAPPSPSAAPPSAATPSRVGTV